MYICIGQPETLTMKLEITRLANELKRQFPEIRFAFLFGSSQDGMVRDGGDIDLAVWLENPSLFIRDEAMDAYAAWYSLTCREYEDALAWMKKQLIYRGYEVQWDH